MSNVIRPQVGPQEEFLATSADIAIYGGAAGSGKTWAVLLEPLRHVTSVPGFNTVFFRRTTPQITNPGGLWDASMKVFPLAGGRPTPHIQKWVWKNGGDIKMSHLEHDTNVLSWQGTELALIVMDELTHFTAEQFWYMLSRNRSTCGVRPYFRATTNPDPDSWVRQFISWWIGKDGFPIPERSGKLRYFVRVNDVLEWADNPQELIEQFPGSLPKSVTFISAKLTDNQILMQKDPGYLATLQSLPRVERERLLGGNWNVRKDEGSMFPSAMANIIQHPPMSEIKAIVRKWDLAATKPSEGNPDPDATVGVLMAALKNGRTCIIHMERFREDSHEVRKRIKKICESDRQKYNKVYTILPIDPAQAGKDQFASMSAALVGYRVHGVRETGDKITRAEPFSAQWTAGNVDVVMGNWNEAFFAEMSLFPPARKSIHDDVVDAASGAFTALTGKVKNVHRFKTLAA